MHGRQLYAIVAAVKALLPRALHTTLDPFHYDLNGMVGPPRKRARRDDKPEAELPQKKYYRQRAHANPFSDHDLQ